MKSRAGHGGTRLGVHLVIALSLLTPQGVLAQQAATPRPGPPGCGLGLVLSGGGARGLAHIGALQALEEHGIRPGCIVGASMGSIVGSLYAAGHAPDEIEGLLRAMSFRDLYTEPRQRQGLPILHRLEQQRTALRIGVGPAGLRLPRSLLNDAGVNRMLISALAPAGFLAGRSFEALPIPFRTVGTDLNSGNRLVLAAGDLARAVRASMSVPLAYPPVRWGNALLVDGGLTDNIPVDLAKRMGAQFTIAVDVSTPLEEDVVPDLAGVTQRIIDLLFTAKNSLYATPPDLTIRPDIGDHSFADYSGAADLIARGKEAVEAALEQIPSQYRNQPLAPRQAPHGDRLNGLRITSVEVQGLEYLDLHVVLREFGLEPGDAFDFDRVLDSLDHIATSGIIERAWVDLEPDGDDGIRILLDVDEQYRHTVDLGLAYQSDDQVQGLLRLETRNLLGRGDRLQLRGYASTKDRILGLRLHGEDILGAHLGYQIDFESHEERPKVFADTRYVNRAEFNRRHVQVMTNLPFSLSNLLQLGIRFGRVNTTGRLGLPFPEATQQHRILLARYVWDDLSSLTLSRRGKMLSVLAERNEESLGATSSYWRMRVDARAAVPIGRLTAEGRARLGYSTGELPVYEWFRIGGPGLVPGMAREELWGPQALAGSATLSFEPYSVLRVYARAGAGSVWQEATDIGLSDLVFGAGIGVTLATPIGPVQADYGWARDGRNRLYFSLGWQ